MRPKTVVWDAKRSLERLIALTEPGIVGFYRSVEVTEIIGFQSSSMTNLLTLVVAEPTEAPSDSGSKPVLLNGKTRHGLRGTDWDIGIVQYRLTLEGFRQKFAEFADGGQWQLSTSALVFGSLAAVSPEFVPSDGNRPHPWNGILKNNFFEGAHVFELFDTTKSHVLPLLDDSQKLTGLADIVGRYLPIRLDGMSDRLGNVIIQIPVTVISTVERGSPEGDHSVGVAWHPEAIPRSLRIAAEIWNDSTMYSFDSKMASTGEAKLRLNSPGGGARTHIWDDENRVLLQASTPVTFITSMSFSMSVANAETTIRPRQFLLTDSGGARAMQSLVLVKPREEERLIGSRPDEPREPWVAHRLFGESVVSLRARKEFVQYGIDDYRHREGAKPAATEVESESDQTDPIQLSRKFERRMEALDDLRWLMTEHGHEGVWLWDPYLGAEDVLRTLFFCPHEGVPLRALTAAKIPPSNEQKKAAGEALTDQERRRQAREKIERDKVDQANHLDAAKGNCHGLNLEFRMRRGGAGWGFHDRFIIFPRAQGSALAWSLGTSINSFGEEHHILQKVSHGEPIAQAFRELWGQLEGADYLIWRTSTNGDEQK